ncbi:MAG: tetratricopeptide repeat protein [Bacteriovoracaceae bacterium]|nr:tetratricopeptide repeat protein [Bacteriovoracaceae bacterium]
MKKKYKLRLKSKRIVGPFTKEQLGELYLKGHIDGTEQFQIFPGGQWHGLTHFKEVEQLILKIISKDISSKDLKENFESETIINLSLAKFKDKIKHDNAKKASDKPKSAKKNDVKNKPKVDGDFKEFKYVKKDKKIEFDPSVVEEPEEKEVEQKNEVEKTRVIRAAKSGIHGQTKTFLNPDFAPIVVEEEEIEEPEEEVIEEEVVSNDGKTEFVDLKNLLPELKKDVKVVEKDFNKKLVEIQKQKDEIERKKLERANATDDDDDDDDEEDEEDAKQKRKKKIILFLVLLVGAYLFLDEDNPVKTPIKPFKVVISFPVSEEFEKAEEAVEYYKQGVKAYRVGRYTDKALALKKFHRSLELRMKNNASLGYLIMIYAELYNDAKDKRQAGAAIFNLIRYSKNLILSDINIVMGLAIFYTKLRKFDAARNMVETYLRFTQRLHDDDDEVDERTLALRKKADKPSLKLLSVYLRILIEIGDFIEAEKVFEKLKDVKILPIEGYNALARYLEVTGNQEEVLAIVKKERKIYPKHVSSWFDYADYLGKTKNIKEYKKVMRAIKILRAERSPVFYAKFLEYQGDLKGMTDDKVAAAKYYRKSLKIHETDELRSKLAAFERGGEKKINRWILESQVVKIMRKAKVEMKRKNWDKAFIYAVEAEDLYDTYIPALLLLAQVQIVRGFYESALETLEKLIEEFPTNEKINFALINAYIGSYRMEDARKQIHLVSTSKFVTTYEYASVLGRYYLERGDVLLTLKWMHESVSRNPVNDEDYFLLAKIYLDLRKYKKGKMTLMKAIDLDPQNVNYQALYARTLYELDSAEVAIGYLRGLLKKYPDHPKLLAGIATYYYRSGQIKNFEVYKRKIELLPDRDPEFFRFLIKVFMQDEQTDEVIKYCEELLKVEPGDLKTRMILGENYLFKNDFDRSLKAFLSIESRLKSFPRTYYFIAKLYIMKKNYEKAMEYAEKEIAANKNLEYGYFIKGEILKEQGKINLSIGQYERALSINGKYVEALLSLAYIKYHHKLLYDEAREYYARAKKEDPANPGIYLHLGNVYKEMGQGDLAHNAYKVYLELRPDAPKKRQIKEIMQFLK